MKLLMILVVVLISFSTHADTYPGLEPDCWNDARAVHNKNETDEIISDLVEIIKIDKTTEYKLDYLSTNKGYSFSFENSRPDSSIVINSEKRYLLTINLKNTFALSDVKWINENLLFFRAYLGQEAFIDLIFNVESEEMVHAQLGRYSKTAFQQYIQGCKLNGGCKCVQKR